MARADKDARLKRRWFRSRIRLTTSPYLSVARVLHAEAGKRREDGDPFDYTETTLRFVVLRQHATRFQFSPQQLRRMHRDDLGYLAGVQIPNPLELTNTAPTDLHEMSRAEQEIKVIENAQRAERELQRRDRYKAPLIASAVGAFIGGVVVVGVSIVDTVDGSQSNDRPSTTVVATTLASSTATAP